MENYPDIDRLQKVTELVNQINEIFYNMDEKEYKRMRDYIVSRFDFTFPYNNPAIMK